MKMYIMKCHSIWASVGLMIIGFLVFSSISFAEQGKWTKKANMPTPRSLLSTSVVNGKIYAIGGRTAFGEIGLPITDKYDPITDTWTKKADMPTARAGLSTSVVNGKIYAIGGSDRNMTLSIVVAHEASFTTEHENGFCS